MANLWKEKDMNNEEENEKEKEKLDVGLSIKTSLLSNYHKHYVIFYFVPYEYTIFLNRYSVVFLGICLSKLTYMVWYYSYVYEFILHSIIIEITKHVWIVYN